MHYFSFYRVIFITNCQPYLLDGIVTLQDYSPVVHLVLMLGTVLSLEPKQNIFSLILLNEFPRERE